MKEFINTETYSAKADVGLYMGSGSRNASISDESYRKKGMQIYFIERTVNIRSLNVKKQPSNTSCRLLLNVLELLKG